MFLSNISKNFTLWLFLIPLAQGDIYLWGLQFYFRFQSVKPVFQRTFFAAFLQPRFQNGTQIYAFRFRISKLRITFNFSSSVPVPILSAKTHLIRPPRRAPSPFGEGKTFSIPHSEFSIRLGRQCPKPLFSFLKEEALKASWCCYWPIAVTANRGYWGGSYYIGAL